MTAKVPFILCHASQWRHCHLPTHSSLKASKFLCESSKAL